jgi:hypothetical protein
MTDSDTDHKLAKTLIEEFPCRPHWTKNTREIFDLSAKHIDPDVSRCFYHQMASR